MSFVDDMLAASRPGSLATLRLPRRQSYFPSPASWPDEVVYFLLVDRGDTGFAKVRASQAVPDTAREARVCRVDAAGECLIRRRDPL
jgi:hypothetical protein